MDFSGGFPCALPRKLPRVIEDALTVVHQLGFQYLWVDRYCICQGDEGDLHTQIRDMDLIFSNAHVTIVAAAGVDPTRGLPGVGNTRRSAQAYVQVGKHELASTMGSSKMLIQNSKWMSRGWTYQEAVFSRRRLVFTEEQVYFECSSVGRCEVSEAPPRCSQNSCDRREQEQEWFDSRIFHGLRVGSVRGKSTFNHVWRHIAAYCNRELTYQSDILNGILGIFRALESTGLRHLWGMPFMLRRPWEVSDTLNETFVQSLCWESVHPGLRRSGFPSWSWTGWTGLALFVTRFDFDRVRVGNFALKVRFSVTDSNENLIDIGAFQDVRETDKLKEVPKCLHLFAWCIKLRFEYAFLDSQDILPGIRSSKTGFRLKHAPAPWTKRDVILSLDKAVNEKDELFERLQTQEWDCVIVGRHINGASFIIVLDWIGDVAERIGFASSRNWMCEGIVDGPNDLLERSVPVTQRWVQLE